MKLGIDELEALLKDMGKRGLIEFNEDEIDDLLAHTPEVKMSERFRERALAAMERAQQLRQKKQKDQ